MRYSSNVPSNPLPAKYTPRSATKSHREPMIVPLKQFRQSRATDEFDKRPTIGHVITPQTHPVETVSRRNVGTRAEDS